MNRALDGPIETDPPWIWKLLSWLVINIHFSHQQRNSTFPEVELSRAILFDIQSICQANTIVNDSFKRTVITVSIIFLW